MTTKKEAIAFAQQYNWTAADAKRAFADLDLSEADEQTLLTALAKFAGSELLERQRLQAAQKGLVTKKKNQIKEIEVDFQKRIEEEEKKLSEMRSLFLPVIARLYSFSKPLGLKDPWIEAMLATYEQHHNQQSA